jgi:hypothetical protein
MKRTVLLRLAAVVVALAAIAVVAVVAYNIGVNNAHNAPVIRGMHFEGHGMGWVGFGPDFGLIGFLGFVAIGVLVIWLLAALLSPAGRLRSSGPAAGDVEKLRELSDMHTAGKLTDDEFSAAKRKFLGLQ